MRLFLRQIFPSLCHEPVSCIFYQTSNCVEFPSFLHTEFQEHFSFFLMLHRNCASAPVELFPFSLVLVTRYPKFTSRIELSSTNFLAKRSMVKVPGHLELSGLIDQSHRLSSVPSIKCHDVPALAALFILLSDGPTICVISAPPYLFPESEHPLL